MNDEEIDLRYIYDPEIIMDDLNDSEIDYLEQNDPDRLGEIGRATNDFYRSEMLGDEDED